MMFSSNIHNIVTLLKSLVNSFLCYLIALCSNPPKFLHRLYLEFHRRISFSADAILPCSEEALKLSIDCVLTGCGLRLDYLLCCDQNPSHPKPVARPLEPKLTIEVCVN